MLRGAGDLGSSPNSAPYCGVTFHLSIEPAILKPVYLKTENYLLL